MKQRKRRKQTQELFRKHRAYYWAVQKLAEHIGEIYDKACKDLVDNFFKGKHSA